LKLNRTSSTWDRDNRNGINNNWSLLEEVIKKVNDLVVNGQLTPQQYAELLQVFNGFIRKGDITMDDMSESIIQMLNSADPEFNLLSIPRDNSVSPIKTTFFNSINLFDGNYLDGMLVRDNYGEIIRPVYNYDNYQGKVAMIPIEAGKTYDVSIDRNMATAFRVGVDSRVNTSLFYTYGGSKLTALERVIFNGTADDMTDSVSFTARAGENYAYVYVSSEGVEVPMQFMEVTLKPEVIPPLRKESVTPEMTSFFEISEGDIFEGTYYNASLFFIKGELYPIDNGNFDYNGRVAVVPVEPETTYTVSVTGDLDDSDSGIFSIALTNDTPVFYPDIETPADTFILRTITTDKSFVFTTESNSKYALIQVSNNGQEPEMLFKQGNEIINKNFIPLKYLDVAGIRSLGGFGEGRNLYDGNLYRGILFRDSGGKVLRPVDNYDGLEGRTAVIPIESGKTYKVKVDLSYTYSFRVGAHSIENPWQTHPTTAQLDRVLHDGLNESLDELTFTARSGDNYLFVYYAFTGTNMPISVTEQEGGSSSFVEDSGQKGRFNMPGNFQEYYAEPELINFYDDPNTLTPKEYHDKFQALINRHSDIASYRKIGEDDFGNPLYVYEIKPLDYVYATYYNQNPGTDGDPMPHPKVFFLSGIHGREKSVSYSIYHMFESILDNPQNLDSLDAIKMHIHIQAIPIGSPNGFIDNSYSNRNGVNVSRDFPPDGNLTQGESKAIFNFVNDNADMDFFIDFHNMRGRHQLIGYSLTDNPFFQESTLQMYRSVGRHWQKNNSNFPQAINHRWAYTGWVNPGTIEWYTEEILGIPTTLLEIPFENDFVDEPNNGPVLVQLGVDMLMNTLFSIIRYKQ